MPLEENGFLGKEIYQWIEKYREDNREWFDICYNLNKICHDSLRHFIIDINNGQQVMCSTLFSKALSSYQATIILLERGLISDAQIILRSLLETTFTHNAIAKNEEVMREYVKADDYNRLKKAKKIRDNPEILAENRDEVVGQITKKISELNQKKPKKITAAYLAEKAGLKILYDVQYSILSDPVHSSPSDLEQYFTIDKEGDIALINWGPSVTGIDQLLATAFETMIIFFEETIKMFSLDINLDAIEQEYNKLATTLKSGEWATFTKGAV